ncbi:MFS transporter [Acuticoccus sediminis]|uniref:MFS transporter n=1 Tax=Acuticoccus sediminis TaxID=2184697 RepID=A0A8B2NZT6_9HYPH|nr:MFS transporter [Acuticoccus sediminis]
MARELSAAPRRDGAGSTVPGRWRLLRWFASSATLAVPQAAGPVAFSLVALSLLGDATGGAAMILAMTLAQVAGAIPITRLGRRWPAATVLRLLVAFRTLALAGVALATHYQAPFAWLIVCAALAGSVNGAAYGYLRPLLNHLTPASRLPRALGVAATLNEVTFVLAPVAASGLGTISPVFAVLALTVLGALPALLIPQVGDTHVRDLPTAEASVLSPSILLWLTCAAASGATVASIEIGAVALALKFGYEPALAILFTVPLCLASVTGGVWVSVRNRMASRRAVVAQLAVMAVGAALAAFGASLGTTVAGAVLIGLVLAPLGTYYTLVLDTLAPPHKRPEVFALLRTANALGVIFASAVLTAASLGTALTVVTGTMVTVAVIVGFASIASGSRQPRSGLPL